MSVERAMSQMRAAEGRWDAALRQHRLAPPDARFSRRLRDFADACEQQQTAYGYATTQGLGWTPLPPASARPLPHELSPDSGRRGPDELWQRLDQANIDLNRALEGVSLQAIARAFGELAEIAHQLSAAVADQDATRSRRRTG